VSIDGGLRERGVSAATGGRYVDDIAADVTVATSIPSLPGTAVRLEVLRPATERMHTVTSPILTDGPVFTGWSLGLAFKPGNDGIIGAGGVMPIATQDGLHNA
jgi:hypothetical protein